LYVDAVENPDVVEPYLLFNDSTGLGSLDDLR
jgi:hypothetical protein